MPTNPIDRLDLARQSVQHTTPVVPSRVVPDAPDGEDVRLVESRAAAFARELGAEPR